MKGPGPSNVFAAEAPAGLAAGRLLRLVGPSLYPLLTDLLEKLLGLLPRPWSVVVGEVHVSEACVAVASCQAGLAIETVLGPKSQDLQGGVEQPVGNVTPHAGWPRLGSHR
jgi:hypothetical protein